MIYRYDALGRLVQVGRCGTINRGVQSTYGFDAADNRSNVTVVGVGGANSASGYCNASNGTDFNGDGRDDILWRNDDGTLTDWLAQADGSFVGNDANISAFVAAAWTVAGTGDVDGDGRDDIIWRNSNGNVVVWLGIANGGFSPNNSYTGTASTSWTIAGDGDFNGDGRADVLWRTDTGAVTTWFGNVSGGFDVNPLAATPIASGWQVAGVGDVNGDGNSDIVWRNVNGDFGDWLGQSNGGFFQNGIVSGNMVATSWHVVGVGDFNGDGLSDVLWRNDNGDTLYWQARSDGGFITSGSTPYNVATSWTVNGAGDYNGDGRSDILWRDSNGTVGNWLSNGDGTFTIRDGTLLVSVPTSWHVQRAVTF